MATWNEYFRIGSGEKTTDDDAPPVYRSYLECGIDMNAEKYQEIKNKGYRIYQIDSLLKNIRFTPRVTPSQVTSEYYFLKLELKIPRPN